MEKITIKSFNDIFVKNVNPGEYKSKKDAIQLIEYIFGCSKIKEKQKPVRYTGGYGVNSYNPYLCCNDIYIIKKLYKKIKAGLRHVYHIVVSFPKYIEDVNTIKLVSVGICQYLYKKGFQCIYGIHEDTENLHIHIAVNSTSYKTGNQVNLLKKDLENIQMDLKKIAYHILKENGY